MSVADRNIAAVLTLSPVIAVYTPRSVSEAVDTARALVRGGIGAIEVTMRNAAALDALRAIANEVPQACVGAGTVLNARQLDEVLKAGATFVVSPGCTADLFAAACASGAAFLPGIATASELMLGLDAGFSHFKFFPASTAGGPELLRAFSGPFTQARFCPTGGITPQTASTWLTLPNVACIGGSWLTPAAAIDAKDWARIETLAREAHAIPRVARDAVLEKHRA
jgi:2-dehydro-3-deoxyphosphogluconate aldolase/(4S)-4-hydroxy-2-oxoglutarate aldolase